VGLLARRLVTRQLKQVSASLKRAEADLRIEREQIVSYEDGVAEAEGEHLTIGNGATRDESFRANRALSGAKGRVTELEQRVRDLRTKQDNLLDQLGNLG
jgi:hypothetical protein